MTCKQARIMGSAAMDGELSEREKSALKRHLSACEACRAEQASLAELRETMALWADEEPSPWLGERFAYNLARHREEQAQPVRPRSRWMFGTAAAGLATALLVAGFFLTHQLQQTTPPEVETPSVATHPREEPRQTPVTPNVDRQEAGPTVAPNTGRTEASHPRPNAGRRPGGSGGHEVRLDGRNPVAGTRTSPPTTYAGAPNQGVRGGDLADRGGESRTDARELLNKVVSAGAAGGDASALVAANLGETGLAMNETIEIMRGTLRKAVDELEAEEAPGMEEGGTL